MDGEPNAWFGEIEDPRIRKAAQAVWDGRDAGGYAIIAYSSRDVENLVRTVVNGYEGREVSPETLKEHYLAGIECDHEAKQDKPSCSCSRVNLGWHDSVGAAVDAWIAHAVEAEALR